jgi:hypothetical protein
MLIARFLNNSRYLSGFSRVLSQQVKPKLETDNREKKETKDKRIIHDEKLGIDYKKVQINDKDLSNIVNLV